MKIRRMYPGEGKKLSALLRLSVHMLAAGDYSPEELEAWAPQKMDEGRFSRSLMLHFTWVAEEDGKIIGFICIERDGYINRLFTHPDYVRRGVATALLRRAEEWAKKRGIRRVFLSASRTGTAFYLKNGYSVCGIERTERHGVKFENKVMEKFV